MWAAVAPDRTNFFKFLSTSRRALLDGSLITISQAATKPISRTAKKMMTMFFLDGFMVQEYSKQNAGAIESCFKKVRRCQTGFRSGLVMGSFISVSGFHKT
jgi:hypothetical protein